MAANKTVFFYKQTRKYRMLKAGLKQFQKFETKYKGDLVEYMSFCDRCWPVSYQLHATS